MRACSRNCCCSAMTRRVEHGSHGGEEPQRWSSKRDRESEGEDPSLSCRRIFSHRLACNGAGRVLPCRMVPGGCITSRGMNREPPAVVWRRCPCGRRIQIKPHIEPGAWMDTFKWDLGGGTFWLTPPPPLSLSLYERASITTQNHRIPLSPWDRVSNRRVGTLGVTSEGKT